MIKENQVEALNRLIEINNDRMKGYETASKETDENDLKEFFSTCERTSQECKTELVNEVRKLGGTATTGTSTSGKLYRAWMDVKTSLTNKKRKAILDSCEYAEDVAKSTYQDVLKDSKEDLTNEQQSLLKKQYDLIKKDHDKVKALRDLALEHK